MANYSLVINSRFKPFSFERYIQPLQIYGQAYREMEDAYGALGIQAGTVESMLNKELDRDAYNQYQGYMQGLKENADILATQGLNPTLRNSLMNMRNRYSQEIIPIQKAAERREKLAEEQRKLGNNYIFDFNASNTSLSEFMNNPSLNYRSIDRIELLKEAQNQFSQFQNELREFKVDPSRRLDRFHKTLIESYGFSPEQAANYARQVASGQMDESTAIGIVANNLYNSTGVAGWNNQDASNRVWQTIAEGLPATVGKTNASVMNDEQALIDAKAASELNTYKEKLRIAAEQQEQQNQADMMRAWDPNTAYLFQGTGVNGQSNGYQYQLSHEMFESFVREGLMDQDGNITSLGISVLNSPNPEGGTPNTQGGLGYSYNGSNSADVASQISSAAARDNFRQYVVRGDRANPNVVGTAVSRLNITGEDRDNLERAIKTAVSSGDGQIYSIGRLDPESHLITDGNAISASDFDNLIKSGVRVKYIGNNSYTDQIFFQMDDGTWYHMPSSVYSSHALDVISQNNRLLQQGNLTPTQEALYGNNIMTQLGQPLNHDTGTPMKKNDGTITFPIE